MFHNPMMWQLLFGGNQDEKPKVSTGPAGKGWIKLLNYAVVFMVVSTLIITWKLFYHVEATSVQPTPPGTTTPYESVPPSPSPKKL